MDRFLVTGGARLDGTVHVSGAKNSALKLMAASILAPGRSVVTNVPRIRDCTVMAEMLEHVGVGVRLEQGVAELDATSVTGIEAPHELAQQVRASIVVLGPLLARCGPRGWRFPAATTSARGRSTSTFGDSSGWARRSGPSMGTLSPRLRLSAVRPSPSTIRA